MNSIKSLLAPFVLITALLSSPGCSGCIQITGCDLGLGGGMPADEQQAQVLDVDVPQTIDNFVGRFVIQSK